MTCIVGLRTDSGVLLAGDSLGSAGSFAIPRRDPKVFRLSREVACGFTSSYRMGQILRYHVEPPPVEGDEYDWAVREFVPVIRDQFREHGFLSVENNEESAGGFLLAVRGRLFQVEADLQVAESAYDFDSCGAGYKIALGALFVLTESNLSPKAVLRKALNAASVFSGAVRGPYVFAATCV